MSMGLVRRNVNIYGEQWLWLRRRAYEAGISVSAALRDVIAEAMDRVQVDVIHPATGQAVTIDGTMVTAERRRRKRKGYSMFETRIVQWPDANPPDSVHGSDLPEAVSYDQAD